MTFIELRNMLQKHNLSVGRFSNLISTSVRSIHKYCKGDESLRQDTKHKIEEGLMLLEESGIMWPSKDGIEFDYFRMMSWRNRTYVCDKQFKEFANERLATNT
jgi:hypothetical protein